MSRSELERELAAGVRFSGAEIGGVLAAVMGSQMVKDVMLIRHAYVFPQYQGRGIGSELLAQFMQDADRPVLIGTWADATWAIRFYERNGFELAPPHLKADLLRTYWTIPERQIETSVVLQQKPV
jgi:GNAT superfamily N-acetyltransferase